MFGSGSAGIGIIDLLITAMKEEGLSEEQARKRIYAFNRYGLLVEGARGIKESQQPLVRKREDMAGWKLSGGEDISLLDVVRNAKVTVLAGVSAQAGAFTEEIVREMARHTERPIIFPLSNPTSQSEAAPADLLRWTDGRALVGTGSPFPPVEIERPVGAHFAGQQLVHLSRARARAFCVAGAARDRRHDYGRGQGAGRTVALRAKDKTAPLLPPIADSRKVALVVSEAVARQAMAEGVATIDDAASLPDRIRAYMWNPVYVPYERIDMEAVQPTGLGFSPREKRASGPLLIVWVRPR